jgi:hypothetical protein
MWMPASGPEGAGNVLEISRYWSSNTSPLVTVPDVGTRLSNSVVPVERRVTVMPKGDPCGVRATT